MAEAGFTQVTDVAPAPVAQAPAVQAPVAVAPAEPTAPVAEEPIVTPDPAAPAPAVEPQTQFNEEDYLKTRFEGKFKSLEEVEKEYKTISEKANKNPYYDDRIKGMNEAMEKGIDPDLYWNLSKIDVEKLTPRDLLILEKQWKDGLSKEDAEFTVERAYKLGLPEKDEDGNLDLDVRDAQIRMKVDAKNASEYLKAFKTESLTPAHEKQIAQTVKAWEGEMPSLEKELSIFSVNTKHGEQSFTPSKETVKKAMDTVNEAIKSGMLDKMPDTEGKAMAKEIARQVVVAAEYQNWVETALDNYEKAQAAKKHNIRTPDAVTPPVLQTEAERQTEWLAKQYGVNLR